MNESTGETVSVTVDKAVEVADVPAVTRGMRCPVCDNNGWHNLGKCTESKDYPDLMVCATCGFIAYDIREEDEPKLLEFYRNDYRSSPGHKNLLTTTTKKNYILKALKPILDKAKADGKKLVCGDWGCATGYIPAALRDLGHRATGSEYTRGFRRFAEAYYGIAIAEELPSKYPYDLITCYHVLEHMVAPDKKLARMKELLADDGRILISTPEWLADLEIQSGEELQGQGHYYHKNHINAFTEQTIKALFAKVGLVIEWEDHVVYGQTYILRKAAKDEAVVAPPTVPPAEVVGTVRATLAAIDRYLKGDFRSAVALYPRFPEAWLGTIFQTYSKDPVAQEAHFRKAGDVMNENARLYYSFGAWLFQHERFAEAERVFRRMLEVKPNLDAMMKLGWCAIHAKDYPTAIRFFEKVAELHPPSWAEAMEMCCKAASSMPHWEERARLEAAKVFAAQAQTLDIKPTDAGFDA